MRRFFEWLGIIKPEPEPDFIDARPHAVAAGTRKPRLPKLLP
jgi:hypothetical protein